MRRISFPSLLALAACALASNGKSSDNNRALDGGGGVQSVLLGEAALVLNRGSIHALLALVLIGCLCCAGPSAAVREGKLGAGEQGMASTYSSGLAGRRTANGEHYDPNKLTAAHPAMPMGTYVRVTRTDGDHQSVVVRINDRCAGRRKIIEVSRAAARQLEMLRAGLVPVSLEIVAAPKN